MKTLPRLVALLAVALCASTSLAQSYKVERIKVPREIVLEVGGMGFWDDGTLVMCTRRGEVWLYKDGNFKQWAFGLHEPLGLLPGKQNEIYVVQRGELSRIEDTDGDREADVFETLTQSWGYTGNYHEYAFGLVRDKEGNFYGNLGLGFKNGGDEFKGRWLGSPMSVKYRGWVFKITPKGEFVPFASGLRAPNGIGMSPAGDIFTTDNQGSYIACGWLIHATKGDFLGHPSGLRYDPRYKGQKPWEWSREKLLALRKRPAVFIPHGKLGSSTSEPTWDTTGGKFGPFAGQVLVGDVQQAKLNRVALEKVDGEFQGAVFPFIHGGGYGPGTTRTVFDKNGVLWVGQTGRGWAAGEGLQKITFTGKTPHMIHSMNLTKTGFRLTFTKPVKPEAASTIGNYSLKHFEMNWHRGYGTRPSKQTQVTPTKAIVSPDGLQVELVLPELATEKIYELNIAGLDATDGSKLEHPTAFYTLNRKVK